MEENRKVDRNCLRITSTVCLVLLGILMLSANATALDLNQFEFVANTTCDSNGHYEFTDLYNGNYTVVATDTSSDGTKWYAGHINATLNGTDLVDQNIKINSTNEVELNHNEILGLLNRSSISGMTYVMKTTYPKQSTIVMVEQETGELVANTTCDAAGNYSLNDVPDGDYTIFAVYDASTVNTTKWYRGMLNVTVIGADLTGQDMKINSSNNIEHTAVLGLLNRSSISGMTYVMKPAYPKQSTIVMVEQETGELVADTTCDAAGNYNLNDIPDGDYTVFAVYDASTANTTKWYRGMLNVTVSGADLTGQDMKINSSNNIDHAEVLGLLDRSSISGMTYVMKTTYPKQSTVVLLKPASGQLRSDASCTEPEIPPANNTEPYDPVTSDPDESNYGQVFRFFSNTTSDEFGDYLFSNVPNGDYLIKA
ncbi:MAG: hypothetical protein JW705_09900, partial [Methanosarcinaceae archaeon]|nr:hypothetical protein [Methanosarcinaceae archaeon]